MRKKSSRNSKLFEYPADHLASFDLPYPPSVNNYYGRTRNGSVYIKQHGKVYRQTVVEVLKPFTRETFKFPLRVEIEVYCPDKRRRDLDNIKKALLDSLTHAQVYQDDCLIDDIRAVRGEIIKGGKVVIHLHRLQRR